MWFLHVFVVLTVLQWPVVTGEGRTDQFTLSLCRVWEECVRTAVDDLSHAHLGTPQAICGDFVEMLDKHGVDCESFRVPEEKTPDSGRAPVSPEQHQRQEPQQEHLPTFDAEEGKRDEVHRHKQGLPDSRHPGSANKPARTHYLEDCSKLYTAGNTTDGVYTIKPVNSSDPISVYCDQTTDGGGWTVIQRRFNGSLEFFREIEAYESGFGNASGEYWLGLYYIHRLTTQNSYRVYIELEDWKGNVKYANYSTFSVGPYYDYNLSIGGYSGTAGDGFGTNSSSGYNLNGANFSTRLFHEDMNSVPTFVEVYGGGWWYGSEGCSCNLNGPYFRDTNSNGYGVYWSQFNGEPYYSLKKTKMMVRPTDFSTRQVNMKPGK